MLKTSASGVGRLRMRSRLRKKRVCSTLNLNLALSLLEEKKTDGSRQRALLLNRPLQLLLDARHLTLQTP